MRALVTGGGGFLGHAIIEQLLARGRLGEKLCAAAPIRTSQRGGWRSSKATRKRRRGSPGRTGS